MKPMTVCRSAALGAGLMYFFDPRQGARRRALLKDAFVRVSNDACHAADVTSRDLRNRFQGLKAEISSYFSGSSAPASDEQLLARIRSHLGRVSSHPRAIEVQARDGRVTLRGPVLAAEAQRVFDCVRNVCGVRHVDNQMEQHQQAGNISALQGGALRSGTQRSGTQWDLMQERWSPATRLLVSAGAASLLACASGRGLMAGTLGAMGMNMLRGNPLGGGTARGPGKSGQSESRRARGRSAQRRMSISAFSGDDGEFEFGEENDSMNVSNIMTPSPATCHRSTKLQEIARLMHQCDCGAIPVVEEGTNHPVGIVTDRDITVRAVAEGRNPLDLTAGDCMTSPVRPFRAMPAWMSAATRWSRRRCGGWSSWIRMARFAAS